MSEKQPDWDKITEGKIRHGIAVEAFSKGMELNSDNMKNIEKWVQFVIHGYDGIKGIMADNKVSKDEPLSDEEALFGKEIPETKSEVGETFDAIIKKQASLLEEEDKNKVLTALSEGKITADNLQVSLDRINEMLDGYGQL